MPTETSNSDAPHFCSRAVVAANPNEHPRITKRSMFEHLLASCRKPSSEKWWTKLRSMYLRRSVEGGGREEGREEASSHTKTSRYTGTPITGTHTHTHASKHQFISKQASRPAGVDSQ